MTKPRRRWRVGCEVERCVACGVSISWAYQFTVAVAFGPWTVYLERL